MILAAREYLEIHRQVFSTLPRFPFLIEELDKSIVLIRESGKEQTFDKTGIAQTKQQQRKCLEERILDISHRITAYSTLEDNKVLLKETKYNASGLRRCNDAELHNVGQGIYHRTQSNMAVLLEFGITEERLQLLQDANTAFLMAVPQTRLGITATKVSTNKLSGSFKEAVAILKKMDLLVRIIKTEHPDLYFGYINVRRVIDTSPTSLVLKGVVIDEVTGEPIRGAIVEFVADGNNATAKAGRTPEMVVKKTAEKGRFNIKALSEGVYTVTIRKSGYADVVEKVTVANGDRTEVMFKLTKH